MATSEDLVCSSCKDQRVNAGAKPRQLVKLATKTWGGKLIYACPYCDGPVIERASKTSAERKKK